MSVESDMYGLLTEVPALAAVTAGAVYPDMLPDNAGYPAFVYALDFGSEEHGLDGPGSLEHYDITLAIYHSNRASLATAADTIRQTLHAVSRATLEGWATAEYIDGAYSGIFVRTGGSAYDFDTKVFIQELYLTLHLTT